MSYLWGPACCQVSGPATTARISRQCGDFIAGRAASIFCRRHCPGWPDLTGPNTGRMESSWPVVKLCLLTTSPPQSSRSGDNKTFKTHQHSPWTCYHSFINWRIIKFPCFSFYCEVLLPFLYQFDSAGLEKVVSNDESEMDISKPRPVAGISLNNDNLQTFKHSAQFFDARIGAPC